MLRNYLLIAIRSIFKRKLFSLINIIGLSISISTALLLIVMLFDVLEYDRFHENQDRIYRIISHSNDSRSQVATSPIPLRETLLTEYAGFEKAVRFKGMLGGDITYRENTIPLAGYYTDPDFFDILGFELLKGDPATALNEPYSLVLSESAAAKLFGEEDPLNKLVTFNDVGLNMLGIDLSTKDVELGDFRITGIIRDNGKKSHIKFDLLASWSTQEVLTASEIDKTDFDDWLEIWYTHTYVLVSESMTREAFNEVLADISDKKYQAYEKESRHFEAEPFTAITPGKLLGNPISILMPREGFYFLGFLSLIIIFSACFNYTNLSIARSLSRSKEIALRKINGANRSQVFIQFIVEAVIIALVAMIVSIILLQFIKPGFSGLWINKYMTIGMNENFMVYAIFVFFTILVGILAGLIPAWLLSSFKPLLLLSNKIDRSSSGKGFLLFRKPTLGKTLIVLQLVVSLFFIITTTLLYFQLRFFGRAEFGFEKENIINVYLRNNDPALVAQEMGAWSGIERVSASSILPATMIREGNMYYRIDEDRDSIYMENISSDPNFITNLGFKIIAGKNFDPDNLDVNKRYMVVNRAAVDKLGFDNPEEVLGLNLTDREGEAGRQVIGVVEDFHFDVFDNGIQPLSFIYDPGKFRYLNVKVSGENLNETLVFMEEKWKELDKVHRFKYEFYDEQLAESQGIFGDMMSIVGFVALIAISIASMGLLGMATYSTETKIKEIGIRKVLGATVGSILVQISRGYVGMLVLAVIIATPIAYYLNNLWLQLFAVRVDFGIGILSIGVLLLLVIGLLAIGSQTLRASLTNPSETLRDE